MLTLPHAPPVVVELRWQLVEDPAAAAVAIMRSDGEGLGWTKVGEYQGDRCLVEGLEPSQRYEFAAASVYRTGGMDPEELWQKVVVVPLAHDDAPARPATPDATRFAAMQDGPIVSFTWTPNDDPVTDSYEIRVGASWDAAQLVARGIRQNAFQWPWWSSGSRTFLLRAVRADGTYSASQASATLDIQPLGDHVTKTTLDESGGGFAGTKSKTAVYTSALELENVPAAASGLTMVANSIDWLAWARKKTSGTYQTADTDLGVLAPHRLEVELSGSFQKVSGLVAADLADVPVPVDTSAGVPLKAGANASWWQNHLADGTPLFPLDVFAEIDTSQTDAPSSPVWDGWRAYTPGVVKCRWVRFRFTLGGFGLGSARITTLKIRDRMKNLKDEGSTAVASSPGPTDVTFAAPFSAAPVVSTTLIGTSDDIKVDQVSVTKTGASFRVYALEPWIERTYSYAEFADPGTSKQLDLVSLPAGYKVVETYIKHGTPAAGTGLATCTLALGTATAGQEDSLATDFDVKQAIGGTVFQTTAPQRMFDAGAATALKARLTTTGCNLDQLTAGSFTVRYKLAPVTSNALREVFTGTLKWHAMGV
jgi:hypothetical protein